MEFELLQRLAVAGGIGAASLAAIGVLIAVASNTVFKLVSGFALGGTAFGLRLAAGLGIPILAGAAVLPFLEGLFPA